MKKTNIKKYQRVSRVLNSPNIVKTSVHTPVMLKETMEYLEPAPGKFIVDGTLDGGGHAATILTALHGRGIFLGIDWDQEMIARAKQMLEPLAKKDLQVVLTNDNYADLGTILVRYKLPRADGILLDLGFSTLQLAESGRGFSFLADEPILMTYSDTLTPVRKLIRELRAEELEKIIRTYGEERFARRISQAIKERLRKSPIETSGALAEVVRNAVPGYYEHGRIHPATRTFQALRMYANHELENLETFLQVLPHLLARSGRVVILSFHSLEDRLVKNYFREFEKTKQLVILTKKPISSDREETLRNPKSRSVKLRAAAATNNQ